MISLTSFLLFVFAVIGFTNIIVDPATIMQPVRDFIEKRCHPWLNKLVSCYQCSGTWVGFFCGYVLISKDPLVVFLCGMAGSFLATFSATFLTYLEARSIVSMEND
jgi:hypothetical protein